jgi:hypothetical protein
MAIAAWGSDARLPGRGRPSSGSEHGRFAAQHGDVRGRRRTVRGKRRGPQRRPQPQREGLPGRLPCPPSLPTCSGRSISLSARFVEGGECTGHRDRLAEPRRRKQSWLVGRSAAPDAACTRPVSLSMRPRYYMRCTESCRPQMTRVSPRFSLQENLLEVMDRAGWGVVTQVPTFLRPMAQHQRHPAIG